MWYHNFCEFLNIFIFVPRANLTKIIYVYLIDKSWYFSVKHVMMSSMKKEREQEKKHKKPSGPPPPPPPPPPNFCEFLNNFIFVPRANLTKIIYVYLIDKSWYFSVKHVMMSSMKKEREQEKKTQKTLAPPPPPPGA